jgi:hypothetical protein
MARGAEQLDPAQRARLRDTFVQDVQLVDGTARLAAMDLLLHGIGRPDGPSLIEVKDSLIAHPGRRWPVVLPNPPFGLKPSLTMVGADGREAREDLGHCPETFSGHVAGAFGTEGVPAPEVTPCGTTHHKWHASPGRATTGGRVRR